MNRIFISYRQEDAKPWALLLFKELAEVFGDDVFLDKDTLRAGNWRTQIHEAVSQSRVVLVIIGRRWLTITDEAGRRRLDDPNDVHRYEIALALSRKDDATVIPIRVDGAPMPRGNDLPTDIRSLTEQQSIELSDSRARRDVDMQLLINDIRRIMGIKVIDRPKLAPRLSPDELRNRSDLLGEIKREVTGRLRQSLHCAVLGKETKPQEVRRPWDIEVKVSAQQAVRLAPDTEIIEVFDEESIAGKLLILGGPGSGKTTTVLQLAHELVQRAETDNGEPMPVLLNLSSWKDDQPLARLVVDGMYVKYGIRKDISERWLDERSLLPLLDGLDEVEPGTQDKCVQAINEFQRAYRPEHLIVCCRFTEYQNCETKLELNGAVHLQPLTDEQIHDYLTSRQHPELWNDIQTAPELLGLARSPLLLSIMALLYEEVPIEGKYRLAPTQEGRKYLFDMYIDRMLARVRKNQQYPREKTLHWLAWLARGLHSHAQTEFLLERLQPSWLESLAQRLSYRISVFAFVVIFVLAAFSLKDWIMDFLPEAQLVIRAKESLANVSEPAIGSWLKNSQSWSMTGLIIDFIVAVIAGLAIGLKRTIKPIESLTWSEAKAWCGMVLAFRRWGVSGLVYGAYIGQAAGLVFWTIWALSIDPVNSYGVELRTWARSGLISGVVIGLVAGVAVLLLARSWLWRVEKVWDWQMISSAEIWISVAVFGLAVGLKMGPFAGVLCGVGIGLIVGLSSRQIDRPNFTVTDGVIIGLVGSLMYGLLTWFMARQLLPGFTMELSGWIDLWLLAWVGVGATFGLAPGLIARLGLSAKAVKSQQGVGVEGLHWLALGWRRWLLRGAVAALGGSLVLGLVMGIANGGGLRAITAFFSSLGIIINVLIGGPIIGGLVGAALGASTVGLPAVLIGSLAGLTGPDIERRTVPNQGIRHAAANAWRFALIGGLVLGTIWGLFNLSTSVVVSRTTPEAWDWFRFCLSAVLLWAPLAALVPGAAWIQHFTLRSILWSCGRVPWRYARFLDYATDWMFLQRIGGRYRFIHDLLRDHFAAMERKQASIATSPNDKTPARAAA